MAEITVSGAETLAPEETTVPAGVETPVAAPVADPESFQEIVDKLRVIGTELTETTKLLMRPDLYDEQFMTENPEADVGEMKANIMLSARHAEDSVMRLGRVLWAMAGRKDITNE